jgi:L-2-amino-thiazoline-4-carboxylic acid hydrolase
MSHKFTETYFISRKLKLLKDFDNLMNKTRSVLVSRYGEKSAETIVSEARQEYSKLIPEIPYVGQNRILVQFITGTAQSLAIYRALRSHGKAVEEAGKLYYLICEALLNSYPRIVHRLIGNLSFSKIYLAALKKGALKSQKRLYPGGYVFSFIDGDGREFDYGVDYSECGGCKFLSKQGASELAPYICTADIIYSELFGWGLTRTKTIAEGFEKCDFRFKKGGKTRVASHVIK